MTRVLITGAGGGIGTAAMAELRKRGATVVGLDLQAGADRISAHDLGIGIDGWRFRRDFHEICTQRSEEGCPLAIVHAMVGEDYQRGVLCSSILIRRSLRLRARGSAEDRYEENCRCRYQCHCHRRETGKAKKIQDPHAVSLFQTGASVQ